MLKGAMSMLLKRTTVSLLSVALCFSAQADEISEYFSTECVESKSFYKIELASAVNAPVPKGAAYVSEPQLFISECGIGAAVIKAVIQLYSPSERGMCGARPGGVVHLLSIDQKKLIQNFPLATCFEEHIDSISLTLSSEIVEVKMCGATKGRTSDYKNACITDKLLLSTLSTEQYKYSSAPLERLVK